MNIAQPSVEMLWITPQPEVCIEVAGRTCYKSDNKITPESAGAFVKKLTRSGHHAMIEHAVASFLIVTDRGISHEIVRHRIASYAQESTRYCNYSAEKFGRQVTFIEPPDLSPVLRVCWENACLDSERHYFDMIDAGASPQIARSALATCTKTEIVMTANLREWMHFITLRKPKTAHPQIRPVAQQIHDELLIHAPNIFDELQ